jgi:hypothetical protein
MRSAISVAPLLLSTHDDSWLVTIAASAGGGSRRLRQLTCRIVVASAGVRQAFSTSLQR